jgi:hypothetical protein
MKRWIRRLAAPLFVLALSLPMSACNSGGNGTNCVQFPFLNQTVCV